MKNNLKVKVLSVKNSVVIADQCTIAETFLTRLVGLMGHKDLAQGEGLLLRPCNDIHMWFMKIPIDVLFLEKIAQVENKGYYRVVSCFEGLKPWKLLPVRDLSASETLELPMGTIRRCELKSGDEICIS